MVVEVPNFGRLEAKLKGSKWCYYKVDHVNYFRASEIWRVAEQAGLDLLDIKGYQHFSYPQDLWRKDLAKSGLARIDFQNVVSTFLRVR